MILKAGWGGEGRPELCLLLHIAATECFTRVSGLYDKGSSRREPAEFRSRRLWGSDQGRSNGGGGVQGGPNLDGGGGNTCWGWEGVSLELESVKTAALQPGSLW